MKNTSELLSVKGLTKHFSIKGGVLHANEDISLTIYEGETLGLVGESGSGKSTFGRTLLQLYRPTAGSAMYRTAGGSTVDLCRLRDAELRPLRRELQMIFQDPYSSLNSRMTVGEIVGEGLYTHGMFRRGTPQWKDETVRVMERCGLQAHMFGRYPHQFSGGQRQRIGIARALAVRPRFVVCDECVSALDVSIRAQILNLLTDLRDSDGLTYLFISHDLSVVRYLSDRIGVMYLGRIVELGESEAIFASPKHPYTAALLSAIPGVDASGRRREPIILQGNIPSPANPPKGCPFHTRCYMAREVCRQKRPPLETVAEGHLSACHFADEVEKREKPH